MDPGTWPEAGTRQETSAARGCDCCHPRSRGAGGACGCLRARCRLLPASCVCWAGSRALRCPHARSVDPTALESRPSCKAAGEGSGEPRPPGVPVHPHRPAHGPTEATARGRGLPRLLCPHPRATPGTGAQGGLVLALPEGSSWGLLPAWGTLSWDSCDHRLWTSSRRPGFCRLNPNCESYLPPERHPRGDPELGPSRDSPRPTPSAAWGPWGSPPRLAVRTRAGAGVLGSGPRRGRRAGCVRPPGPALGLPGLTVLGLTR